MMANSSTPQSQIDADAAFALQVQRELALELDPSPLRSTTPLMRQNRTPRRGRRGDNRANFRINVWQEFQQSWPAIWIVVLFNIPQIVAALFVIPLHWDSPHVCDSVHRLKWKLWALVNTIRLFLHLLVVVGLALGLRWWPRDSRIIQNLLVARNILDGVSFIWFLLGNMWLFDQDDSSCSHPARSPMYLLSMSMLIITYIHLCLPCIIGILLVPVICFCLPCLVRLLQWLRVAENNQGATTQMIDKIPLVQFGSFEEELADSDNTCPICLGNFEKETEVRLLPCKHYFHPACVDEWLKLKANCPTCRHDLAGQSPETNSQEGDLENQEDIEMEALVVDESTGLV